MNSQKIPNKLHFFSIYNWIIIIFILSRLTLVDAPDSYRSQRHTRSMASRFIVRVQQRRFGQVRYIQAILDSTGTNRVHLSNYKETIYMK